MRNTFRTAIAIVLAMTVAHGATASVVAAPQKPTRPLVVDDPAIVERYVARLPIGSTVKVRLTSGEKLTAVLMVVEPPAIVLKPKTRVAVPARTVPINTIVSIEPAGSGIGAVRALLIGAGAGAAAFFGILFLAIAGSD